MGKFKRIQVNDIKAMQKTLDDLPDKNLGKTREEAAEMLNAQIMKALEKGYTIRELAEVMSRRNVTIPAPVIRAKIAVKKNSPKAEPKAKPASKKNRKKRFIHKLQNQINHRTCLTGLRRTRLIRSYNHE